MSRPTRLIVAVGLTLVALRSVPSEAESRPIRFSSGDVDLAGEIRLPTGEGEKPGIVFLHGSGPHERHESMSLAMRFVEMGFAALVFDKRGCGESGGDWTRASLNDLADDAIAAYGMLSAQPEVDEDRVGFFGGSQAGWVVPLASASVHPAFAVILSGGGVTPQESERYTYERALLRAGVSEEDRRLAAAVLDRYFHYLESGDGLDTLRSTLQEESGSKWASTLALGRLLPSPADRRYWQWVASFDPMPWIESMTMPVLLLFGDEDDQQPTDLAVERWRAGLQRAGNSSVTIRVFPGAGHFLRKTDATHAEKASQSHTGSEYVDGFWETIDRWVSELDELGLHMEIAALQRAGLSPVDAIRAATATECLASARFR